MRRIINSTFVSIDGVIKDPQDWPSLDATDDTAAQTDVLSGCDGVLLGRHTYDSFASVWQGRSGDPYTDKMNSVSKYVVSTTMDKADWENTTVIGGDVVAEVARLKDGPGGDILQYGFGRLSHTLMEHGLLDELRLWVHPFFVGKSGGDGLLFQEGTRAMFDVIETKTYASGVVLLSYRLKAQRRVS
ncbi:dihydrofolate reductase family protein [Actinomadura sp. BRA 177]|uniref:dihydrofolate reductase family protein n=1 Tax=Actinomadura sp. BRA 177 TaxID=2745202 RepID=UPI001594E996|nr:dihydrofolate reductase family protein [Actinomadura sp. BRA 177]NVI85920.1 dihydrofolate reductase family protein [Actinomadura sp. BRA 177]